MTAASPTRDRETTDSNLFLRLAARLPRHTTDDDLAMRVCDELVEQLGDALAVTLPAATSDDASDTSNDSFVVVRAGSKTARSSSADVFAPRTTQRTCRLEAPFEAVVLHLRADDALSPNDVATRLGWLDQAALVLYGALGAARVDQDRRAEGERLHALQARVVHTEKLASVGQLAAQVVHELTNPLTAIVSYSDFLKRKLEREEHDDADLERLRRIGESADRILRFCRDLTTFARPAEENAVPIALREIVERAVQFCEHLVAERWIRIVVEADPETPVITGRRGELTQVFVNLITNAAHGIEDAASLTVGEGVITIAVGPGELGGVRVVVGDNGNGISPEHVVRVFDPFFTTKREGRGTGLGLSIVRSIVQAHGGRVWVRSVLGTGSQVIVELAPRPTGDPR